MKLVEALVFLYEPGPTINLFHASTVPIAVSPQCLSSLHL